MAGSWRLQRVWQTVMATLLLTVLSACGGGGGGSSDEADASRDASAMIASARLITPSIEVELDSETPRNEVPEVVVELAADFVGAGAYYYWTTNTEVAFGKESVFPRPSDAGMRVYLPLKYAQDLGRGIFRDTLTINLCSRSDCNSAERVFTVPLTVTVGFFATPEKGLATLPTTSGEVLAHDHIASAYSPGIDALVTAASRPTPAVHVRNPSSGESRSIALAYAPTSLELAPDGLRAIVGHDGAISVVDLSSQKLSSTDSVRLHLVPMKVGSAALDGQRAFVFSAASIGNQPYHVVDLDTGARTAVNADYSSITGLQVLLHPSGRRLYATDAYQLRKIDLTAAVPGAMLLPDVAFGRSPCGRIWLSGDGSRLFSGCGAMAHSSDDPALDGSYAGTVTISSSGDFGHLRQLVSLSEHAASHRLLTLELAPDACDDLTYTALQCHGRLSSHDSQTFVISNTWALPVVDTAAGRFRQKPHLVFQRPNGEAYVLSSLHLAPEPTASLWLARIP